MSAISPSNEDALLWGAAIAEYGGWSLRDIETILGVSRSVARDIKGRTPKRYLQDDTRQALRAAREKGRLTVEVMRQSAAPAQPLPGKSASNATAARVAHMQPEAVAAYVLGLLDSAMRSHQNIERDLAAAREVLGDMARGQTMLLELSGGLGDPKNLVAEPDALEAIQDRQASDAAARKKATG